MTGNPETISAIRGILKGARAASSLMRTDAILERKPAAHLLHATLQMAYFGATLWQGAYLTSAPTELVEEGFAQESRGGG